MNDRYAYPAKSRLTRPEDVEDLGALPDFLKARTTDQPAASTQRLTTAAARSKVSRPR